MKKNFYYKIILIILLLPIFLLASNTMFVGKAEATSIFMKSLDDTARETGHRTDIKLAPFIGRILGYALTFLGVIFLGLTIYGGYIWMIARGNEEKAEKAKKTLRNVVIGLVIVLAAYAITFWLSQALGPSTIEGYIG